MAPTVCQEKRALRQDLWAQESGWVGNCARPLVPTQRGLSFRHNVTFNVSSGLQTQGGQPRLGCTLPGVSGDSRTWLVLGVLLLDFVPRDCRYVQTGDPGVGKGSKPENLDFCL